MAESTAARNRQPVTAAVNRGSIAPSVPSTGEIIDAYYRYVNAGDWTSWVGLFSDDVAGDEQITGHFAGIDVLKGAADGIAKGYSRFRMNPVRVVIEGDAATVIWRTDSADATGVPIAYPNDSRRQVIGANFFQVQNGRIVYMRTIHDTVPFASYIAQTTTTTAAGSGTGR